MSDVDSVAVVAALGSFGFYVAFIYVYTIHVYSTGSCGT